MAHQVTQAITVKANNALNLEGVRFGRLTAVAFSRIHRTPKGSATMWVCVCDCGVEKEYRVGALRSGNAQSCGCATMEARYRRAIHGESHKSKEYTTWQRMRSRCLNPNNPDFHNYGGRGIKVCSRWDDYRVFIADMGRKPAPDYSIERIDVNGDYEPTNCCWIPLRDQSKNRRCVLNRRAA